jgi:hypothetical protein
MKLIAKIPNMRGGDMSVFIADDGETVILGGRQLDLAAIGRLQVALDEGVIAIRATKPLCGARPYPAGSEADDGTECLLSEGHDGPHDDAA